MKQIFKAVLFCLVLALLCSITYGQGVLVPGLGTRAIDTGYVARSMRIDSAVRLIYYRQLSDTVVLGLDAQGKAYRVTKSMITNWGAGGAPVYTNGYGLNLASLVFSVDSSLIATKGHLNDTLNKYLRDGGNTTTGTLVAGTLSNQPVEIWANGGSRFKINTDGTWEYPYTTLVPKTAGNGLLVYKNAPSNNLVVTATLPFGDVDSARYYDNLRTRQMQPLGTIYSDGNWSAGEASSDFVVEGSSTITLSNGNWAFSGGTNSDADRLVYKYNTCASRLISGGFFVIGTKNSTSYGPSVAWGGNSGFIAAKFDMTDGVNSGKVTIYRSNTGYTIASSSALSFSAGDTILLSLQRNEFNYTATVLNLTTDAVPVSVTANSLTNRRLDPISNTDPTSGAIKYGNYGGSFVLDSVFITSNALKYGPLMVAVDSRGLVFGSTIIESTFPQKLKRNFTAVSTQTAGSESLLTAAYSMPEKTALASQQILMGLGGFELANGVDSNIIKSRYDSVKTLFTNIGATVVHLPFWQTAFTSEWFKNWLIRQYGASAVIFEAYDRLKVTGASALNADGIHLSQLGHQIVYEEIINSNKLTNLIVATEDTVLQSNVLTQVGSNSLNPATANTQPIYRRDVSNLTHEVRHYPSNNTSYAIDTIVTRLQLDAAIAAIPSGTPSLQQVITQSAKRTKPIYYGDSTFIDTATTVTVLTKDYNYKDTAIQDLTYCTADAATGVQHVIRRANGTLTAPSAITSGRVFEQWTYQGYGTSAYATGGSFKFSATETWSGSARGTQFDFRSTLNGTTTNVVNIDGNGWLALNEAGTQPVMIGTATPSASTVLLELSSTTRGFLPPRMTTTQRNNISSPPEGLTVYDLTLHKYYFYNGSAWEQITSAP